MARATIGDFDARAKNATAPRTNPGSVYVVTKNSGIAGPFTVRNG